MKIIDMFKTVYFNQKKQYNFNVLLERILILIYNILMTNSKYIRISPAQASWVNLSGRTVFKISESKFTPVENPVELRKNQDFFIPLSKNQIETELDMRSKYQSLMILLSLTNLISSVLLAFNHDSDLNTMMISLIVMWLYTSKDIIAKTIQFNKERSIRKTHYLYGRIYH